MKKINKYTKKNKKIYIRKYTKKNKKKHNKYTRKYNKKSKSKNTKKNFYSLKGGYAPGFVPQVSWPLPTDPDFDRDPFEQFQGGNDTCPFHPTHKEVEHCYNKHDVSSSTDDQSAAQECVNQLYKKKYTESPGKCNRYTCCNRRKCDPITCPPWSRVVTRGIAVPITTTVNFVEWSAKKIKEISQDYALAEEKLMAKGAVEIIKDNKGDLQEASDIIEEIAPEIPINTSGKKHTSSDDASDEKKEGDEKENDAKSSVAPTTPHTPVPPAAPPTSMAAPPRPMAAPPRPMATPPTAPVPTAPPAAPPAAPVPAPVAAPVAA